MAFQIDEAHLPAILTVGPMTDEAFATLCAEHPDLNLELSAQGELIVMPQTFTLTGARNNEISRQLGNWAQQDGRGVAFDSSTGWKLPNGARLSPDAAWVLKDRIKHLAPANLRSFWEICPDFVVELRSISDKPPVLREKLAEWLANGAQLGWLIDPENQTVEVYRPGATHEVRKALASIDGEGVLKGFSLDLNSVWQPLS